MAPKPLFRGFPLRGQPSLTVAFQNFSDGDAIRFLWDFGDGTTSIERSPSHTYLREGIFTVKLNIITTTGAQGIATKNNYVTVSDDITTPFFYVVPNNPAVANFSIATAAAQAATPQTFNLVDQTDGDILQRYWIFDDGTTEVVTDPDIHSTTHIYAIPGFYEPSLIIIFNDQSLKRAFISDAIVVI